MKPLECSRLNAKNSLLGEENVVAIVSNAAERPNKRTEMLSLFRPENIIYNT